MGIFDTKRVTKGCISYMDICKLEKSQNEKKMSLNGVKNIRIMSISMMNHGKKIKMQFFYHQNI